MKRRIESYLLVFYFIIVLGIFSWFRLIKSNSGITEIRKLIDAPSHWDDLTSSPCMFQIVGEPADSGKNYVKVSIKCKNGKSENTVSLKPLEKSSFKNIIELLASVNKFNKDLFLGVEKKWRCQLNGISLEADDVISPTNTITCEEI